MFKLFYSFFFTFLLAFKLNFLSFHFSSNILLQLYFNFLKWFLIVLVNIDNTDCDQIKLTPLISIFIQCIKTCIMETWKYSIVGKTQTILQSRVLSGRLTCNQRDSILNSMLLYNHKILQHWHPLHVLSKACKQSCFLRLLNESQRRKMNCTH